MTVDYYSICCMILYQRLIQKMKAHFSRYGIPEQLVTDNGPQFVSSFCHFTMKYDIQHTTSSPHHPRSNGKAESPVKAAKRILKKTLKTGEDLYLAILNLRNTPQQGIDLSPAQRLMGRRTKTLLPTNANLLRPEHATPEIAGKLKFKQTKQQFYYNKTAKPLRPLQEGDIVRAKPYQLNTSSWEKATVTKRLDQRSYEIETDNGVTLCRNRAQLRATHEDPTPIAVVAEPGPLVAPTGAAPSYEQVETPKTPQRVPRSPVPRVTAKSPVPKVPAKPPESPVKSQTPHVSRSGRSSKCPAHLDEYVT